MSITPQSLTGITNAKFWELCRAKNPNFASHTAKATADTFSAKGFEALKLNDIGAINEFFELSMRIAFQKCDISGARNPLAEVGLVEVYDTPNGGYTQRIAINSIKPISPGFKGIEDYEVRSPFVTKKPEQTERFFGQNFDYQSTIFIQDYQVKTIFISEYGMGEFIAGVIKGLQNGYVLQEYANTKEAIHSALNSTTYPLQDSQKLAVSSWTDGAPTDAELKSLILTLKDLATGMRTQAQTGMYNAGKFETFVDPSEYVCLMRAGIKNRIDVNLEVGAFNPDKLSMPWEVTEVADFGGLIPQYTLDAGTTWKDLQVVYDELGTAVGYIDALSTNVHDVHKNKSDGYWYASYTYNGTDYDNRLIIQMDGTGGTIRWDDPNEEVLAIVAQKGLIFEDKQNPYQVTPIYNPRTLGTHYWASSPNNAINVDPNYNMIAILKPSA